MGSRVVLGWAATLAWISLWGALLYFDWPAARGMSFNEWGDFFAGSFAPLAFLWLVVGYFQQGEELGQNTKALEQQEKALKLQVEELKQSVEQQSKSAIALSRQSSISSLMVRLEATNHMLDSICNQIERAEKLNSAGASKKVAELQQRQVRLEASIEDLLEKVEELEGACNGYE